MMPAYGSQYKLEPDRTPPSMAHYASSARWSIDETPYPRGSAMGSDWEPFKAGYYVPVEETSHDLPVGHQDYAHREQYIDNMGQHCHSYSDPLATRRPAQTYGDRVGHAVLSSPPSPRIVSDASYASSPISWEIDSPSHPNACLSRYIYYDSPKPTLSIPSADIYSQISASTTWAQMQHVSGLPRHAAHQPVPLAQQSSYSELSVNLQFLDRFKREEKTRASPCTPVVSKPSTSEAEDTSTSALGVSRKQSDVCTSAWTPCQGTSMPTPPNSPGLWVPTQVTFVDARLRLNPVEGTQNAPPPKSIKEPKKPSLACEFCKERKIACGRPPEGSEDPTCNQCKLRSFKCIYPKERIPRRSRFRK